MMRTYLLAASALASVVAAATPATGTIITFADRGVVAGTSVGSQYADQGITVFNGSQYSSSGDTFDGQGITKANSSPLLITFSSLANGLSIDYVAISRAGVPVFTTYDAQFVRLETFVLPAIGNASHTFALNNIRYLELMDGSAGTTGISTLTFNNAATAAVPEPASWALMMAGFGAVGFAMRRRSKVAVRVAYA